MIKVEFYFNNITEIFEYDNVENENDREELIWEIEDDLDRWMKNLINESNNYGYKIIEKIKII